MNDNVNSGQNQPNYSAGRELFFYLLSFFTLAIVAVSLGNVWFALANKIFPDELLNSYLVYNNLAWPLSALLVTAPIYWLINWQLEKELKLGKLRRQSKIRKVLLYLVLLVASAVVIGDIIGLLYRFFNGELNLLFLFKVVIVLCLGGWTAWYYSWSLHYDEKLRPGEISVVPKTWFRLHSLALLAVVLAAAAAGFMINGGPGKQQKIKQDDKVLQDVTNLYYSLETYYAQTKNLPDDLASTNLVIPEDVTYKRESESAFLLCANFNLSSGDSINTGFKTMPTPPVGINWRHPAGDYCFKLYVGPTSVKEERPGAIKDKFAPVDLKK